MEIMKIVEMLQKYDPEFLAYDLDSEFSQAVTAAAELLVRQGERIVDLEQRWIPVTERLPESGKHVLAACEVRSYGSVSGRYVCDAYYAAAKSMTGGCGDDFATEYDEEDDEYYLLEGWYEVIKNWDDYNSIVIPSYVTHWMPLPQPPKENDCEKVSCSHR